MEVGDPAEIASLDERRLVERARHDPDAFAELYRAYLDRIHAFAYRRTGSREAAEDVAAATFERALRSLPKFRWTGGGFAPWLYRIAANELADHHRRRQRETTPRGRAALASLAPAGRSADDPADAALGADRAELLEALGTLRPRYQHAITLRYLAGLDHADAAAAMGCSKPVMAVTLHRALAALRRRLQADGGEL